MQSLSSFTQNIPTLKHITLYTLALIRIPHRVQDSAKAADVTYHSLCSLCHIFDVFSLKLGLCNTKLNIAGHCALIIRPSLITKESNPIRFKGLLENIKELKIWFFVNEEYGIET
jgi:hypothetical protein